MAGIGVQALSTPGGRVAPIVLDFSTQAVQTVPFNTLDHSMPNVQSVLIDNGLNPSPVQLTFGLNNQVSNLQAFGQEYLPVFNSTLNASITVATIPSGVAGKGPFVTITLSSLQAIPYSRPNTPFQQFWNSSVLPIGTLGVFGGGNFLFISQNMTWTVPSNVSAAGVRARCWGAGGNGVLSVGGGCGGGYARGVFLLPAGTQIACVVPGVATGGTTSFDSLLTATGGGVFMAVGQGFGGQYQASGGQTPLNYFGGGAGCGSELGNGGMGGVGGISTYTGGGGAPGGQAGGAAGVNAGGAGASPFGPGIGVKPGPDVLGFVPTSTATATNNPQGSPMRFPFDGFVSSGGFPGTNGGPGGQFGGGGAGCAGGVGGAGGFGAGGGGGVSAGGAGGYGGGGGATNAGVVGAGGAGGIVVEW